MQRLSTQLWNTHTRIGISAGLVTSALLLLVWANGFFMPSQLRLNDLFFVPSKTSDHIVIVALDDTTHSAYGRSLASWPRTVYANLIKALNQAQARVLAFDILFDQPSAYDQDLVDAIVQARQSENRTRFVMPRVGADQIVTRPLDFPAMNFNNTLLPIPVIAASVDYLGYVNAFTDVDSVVRRQISLVENRDQTLISFDIAAYLAWLRIPSAAQSQVIKPSEHNLQVASINIPVDENGLWQQNFFGGPSDDFTNTFPIYSALDVISGVIKTILICQGFEQKER